MGQGGLLVGGKKDRDVRSCWTYKGKKGKNGEGKLTSKEGEPRNEEAYYIIAKKECVAR